MTGAVEPGAAPGGQPGTVTAHAWQRLATHAASDWLSATTRLVYLATAHHADQPHHNRVGYAGARPAELTTWTRLDEATVALALDRLHQAGWVERRDHGGVRYAMTTPALAPGLEAVCRGRADTS